MFDDERDRRISGVSPHTKTDLAAPFLTLLPATGVAVTVFDHRGHQVTVCASDATAARVDELQFDLGEGPIFQTLRTGTPELIPDVNSMSLSEWPMFADAVTETPARALFVFPLMMGAVCVGVAEIYRTVPGDLTAEQVRTGMSVARSVAGPALRTAAGPSDDDTATDAESGVKTRRAVHQATGMVLAQLDVTPTEAFSRLRGYAFSSGRTVQDVADDIVRGSLDLRVLAE